MKHKVVKVGDIRECKCGCGGTFTIKSYHLMKSYQKQHDGKLVEYIRGHHSRGKHPSNATRQKMIDNHADFSGENHPKYGTHCSQVTKDKISASLIGKLAGENHPMFGKHHTKKARKAISIGHQGKYVSLKTREKMRKSRLGEKNGRWRGGYELRIERAIRKRRHLGFSPLNYRFEGCVGHHIDEEFIIFIPEDMHLKHKHSLKDKESMKVINDLAFEFMTQQFSDDLGIFK